MATFIPSSSSPGGDIKFEGSLGLSTADVEICSGEGGCGVENTRLLHMGEPDSHRTTRIVPGDLGLPKGEIPPSEWWEGRSTRIAFGPVQGSESRESSFSEEASESEEESRPKRLRGLGEGNLLVGETLVLDIDIEEGVEALWRSLTVTVSGLWSWVLISARGEREHNGRYVQCRSSVLPFQTSAYLHLAIGMDSLPQV